MSIASWIPVYEFFFICSSIMRRFHAPFLFLPPSWIFLVHISIYLCLRLCFCLPIQWVLCVGIAVDVCVVRFDLERARRVKLDFFTWAVRISAVIGLIFLRIMWYYLSHPSRRCFRFLYFDFSAKFVFLFDMVSNFVIRMKLLIGANPLGTFGFQSWYGPDHYSDFCHFS